MSLHSVAIAEATERKNSGPRRFTLGVDMQWVCSYLSIIGLLS